MVHNIYNDFQRDLALLIRSTLAKHNLKKNAVADALKINKSNLTKITKEGGVVPSADTLAKITAIILREYKDLEFKGELLQLISNYSEERFRIKFLAFLILEMSDDLENTAQKLEKSIDDLLA